MEEIWKDIIGFEGLYQVSNLGRVKSFRKPKQYKCADEYIMKEYIGNSGYIVVTLYKSRSRTKKLVHRLVADAFIPNPENLPHVNHKDENKHNNRADNLEWCTPKYNNNYGTLSMRAAAAHGRMIDQFLPNGEWLARYACISIAAKLSGFSYSVIKNHCNGDSRYSRDYLWRYVDADSDSPSNLDVSNL